MNDEINKPSHYMIFPDMEAIDIIRKTLTEEEFKGYCKGNSLKYRLRAGAKGPAETCIAKAKVYEGWLSAPKPSPELWYPDDSGEWVEVKRGKTPVLHPDSMIDIMTGEDRESKEWFSAPAPADSWAYNNVVAYKKVNK